MVDVISSQRLYGLPSKFKRQRVCAVRKFPRGCRMLVPKVDSIDEREEVLVPEADSTKGGGEVAKIKPLKDAGAASAGCPFFQKYPPPKIRKGVTAIRDFPATMNVPTSLRNSMPSDWKDSHSADGTAMAHCKQDGHSDDGMAMACCKQSDIFNAIDEHNDLPSRDFKPLYVPIETNDRDSHSADGTAIAGCKQSDIFSAIDEQDDLSSDFKPLYVPIETNAHDLPACMNAEQEILSMVAKDCKADVKESNLSMVVYDEQCPVDISIATNVNVCSDVKESSSPVVVGDEQCQAILFEVDNDLVALNKEESAKQTSLSLVVADGQCPNRQFKVHDLHPATSSKESEETLMEVSNDLDNKESRIACDKVKEVLHLFQEVYLKLSQHSERKNTGTIPFEVASLIQKQEKCINMDKHLGPIPGVEIGDCFDWRAELSVIGLHHQLICGIDYMPLNGKIVATSVVDSGRYDNVVEWNDEEAFGDVLIYSGQGENPKVHHKTHKKAVDDQKLVRGNLALKNSADAKTPVRVIHKLSSKCAGRKYVYDGLYFVDGYREEKASTGKLVFKFVLKRFPGQAKLDPTKFRRKEVAKRFERKEHVCMYDIAQGKDKVLIRAMNSLDDEKPPIFNYITNVTYSESYHPSMLSGGCNCIGECSDSEDCPCVIKNGGEIPYNYAECIMNVKPLIIECGPSCKCFTSCLNRVSQRGIRLPLEVFKTEKKGWGVRSRSFIPSGGFICEYTGEILGDNEVELKRIGQDEYLFDVGNYYGNSLHDTNSLAASSHPTEVNESFTIDAAKFGNVGRFINHSCSPNVFAQNVLFDHDDKRMPHVMLFAMEDIPALTELSYDYNYKIGEVCDVNGDIKIKHCYCGSSECKGRMY